MKAITATGWGSPLTSENLLTIGAATTGFGGAVVAQVAQNPVITWGTICLAALGVVSLWVRSYYKLQSDRLKNDEMETELKWYRKRDRSKPDAP